ncbi:sterol desaturase family protein [Sediminitomix flava]|uniref:Sterol desaturase/sphingolipid hydroxylase (Fatty acid hydroxylase superfamily) n=1 Tax=Sediminitomix flava TaxID=379075 RepID=A0A315ZES4_SEDFL|nr:sterol desaturase family protein [Sediminitomix flava]PWJ44031.1 sterol desaturase/sphingolipid hydroxylase (fatty acid hydroxylase superfamily) [Sediminitomix flava]
MSDFATNVYIISAPIILGLLILEIVYCLWKKNGYYKFQDTVANIGTAIGNQSVNLVVAAVILKSFEWLHSNYAYFKIENTWWSLALLLLLIDFLFYWFHRLGHTINLFWAAHMPHHSSEEMNLGVGLRASVTQRIFAFTFFWPLPLIGWDASTIYAMVGLHLLASYWHHTRVIPKLGWFEKCFNSPSHHRVHHGVNPQYLDKNFGEFLIIWDKMFGTFEEENKEVCYGVTHPPRTWDPTNIYFQYWLQIWRDAVAAPHWIDKIKVWFMPLGWRPRGLDSTKDYQGSPGYTLHEQVKFRSKQFKGTKPYLVFQVFLGLFFMYITVNTNIKGIDGEVLLSTQERWFYSVALFLMITAWGGILEAKKWSVPLEIFRLLIWGYLGGYVFIKMGISEDWFAYPNLGLGLLVAGSILYVSKFFRVQNTEGIQTSGMPIRNQTSTESS